jgi:ribosome maturation factor RimP
MVRKIPGKGSAKCSLGVAKRPLFLFMQEGTVDAINVIKELVEKPLSKEGYDLAEVSLSHDKDGLTLHILVDRDDPISLDDIVKVSNLLNPLLDEKDPIPEAYTLDISSLGAEKAIPPGRLERYLGRYVAIHLSRPYKGANSLEGDLVGVSGGIVSLRLKIKSASKTVEIPLSDIDKAHLAIKF